MRSRLMETLDTIKRPHFGQEEFALLKEIAISVAIIADILQEKQEAK